MSLYDSAEGVLEYAQINEGIDGREHVEKLRSLLEPPAHVLELGSGLGIDLALLAETFQVTGSDRSPAFRRYAVRQGLAPLLDLDASTLQPDATGACDQPAAPQLGPLHAIYSNKVLHHLRPDQHASSIAAQHRALEPGGLVLHTYWRGRGSSESDGLFFQQHEERALSALWTSGRSESFEIVEVEPYTELGYQDSLRLIARALE